VGEIGGCRFISAGVLSCAFARDADCKIIRAEGASILEQCGDRLNSFSLKLSDLKRGEGRDLHGRMSFNCGIELMCEGEPTMDGFVMAPSEWQKSPKDERAILDLAVAGNHPYRPLPPIPPPDCPLFDVSIDGIAGRAVCFKLPESNHTHVLVVVGDDHMAIFLNFGLRHKSTDVLREKVAQLLPKFKIERATGDAGLMRWIK
jgi:hypothetical protein